MKEFFKDLFWFLLEMSILALVFLLVLCVFFGYIHKENTTIENSDIARIQELSSYIANQNTYLRNYYNCVNFSEDLIELLESEGYQAHYIIGNHYNESNDRNKHVWVRVDLPIFIESTSGEIIPPPKYLRDYYEYKSNRNP